MYNFSESAIPAISGDISNVVRATDAALSGQAQMLATIIEAMGTSDLPINASQRVYGEVVGAINSLLDAREKTRKSVASLTAIGRQSRHQEKMDGCPVGFPTRISGIASTEPVIA